MNIDQLSTALIPSGMIIRGGFHPRDKDKAPPDTQTIIMIGNVGPEMWRAFSKEPHIGSNALDAWTRKNLTPIADDVEALVVFPFDGPPYYPFQHWAMQADDVHPSPIGPLIHPGFGLWHAYRAAFLFAKNLGLTTKIQTASPCDTCTEQPCINTCPVDAFTPGNYDVAECRAFTVTPDGDDCLRTGCRARRACPIGQDHIYEASQAEFHMQSFLEAK